MTITPHDSPDEKCLRVRDALVGDWYEETSREEVNAHLGECRECAEWAKDMVLLTQILARMGRGPGSRQVDEPALISREDTEQESEADEVVGVLDTDEFELLYKSRLVAASQAEAPQSTFQTLDGRLVVTVTYLGRDDQKVAPQDQELAHKIEIAIEAHDVKWRECWAWYRILDAEGNDVAANLVQVKAGEAVAKVSLPQTQNSPYTVHVRVLEDEDEGLTRAPTPDAGPSTRDRKP